MSTDSLLAPLFTTDRMRAIASEHARLQGMLDFEAALARAEAAAGVIPASAVGPIGSCCRAERFDLDALARDAARAGNLAIPMVKALTSLVASEAPDAARYVHWGTTSQDAIDTGLVLQLRAALDEIGDGLARLAVALATLAERHRDTVLAGRTWLQHAQPITLGLKAAGWLRAVDRHRERLHEIRARALVVQLGGAVGSLSALGTAGVAVMERLAHELDLSAPDLPWHAHRDRVAEVATVLGLLVGSLGKVASDVGLLMQTEVSEASEPDAPGRGGSSALPQKRNPVAAAVVRAAALRVPALVSTMLSAMVQEHERGLGGWHAEWETLPEIWVLVAGALDRVIEVAEGLQVDEARMASNLETGGGQIHAAAASAALAPHLGRPRAHELVEAASRRAREQGRPLREALAADPDVARALGPGELDRLFDTGRGTGLAQLLVDRALEAHRRQR